MSQDYNPFEGMDGTTTPGELLAALVKKAAADGDIKPLGGALGMMQKQYEAMMEHLGSVVNQLRAEVGQISMMSDLARLTHALIINILIDKEIVGKEEFEELYKEKVTDVMDKHIEDLRQKQEEMLAEQQKEIEEFAKMAAESGDLIDPATGEAVQLEELDEEEEKEAEVAGDNVVQIPVEKAEEE